MGRNAIPKLDEWSEGSLFRFRTSDGASFDSECGKLIVYERVRKEGYGTETLATAYADGLHELMAAMFADGYSRGKRDGYLNAQADIRNALGMQP